MHRRPRLGTRAGPLNRIVQRDPTSLSELLRRERGKRLGERSNGKRRLGRDAAAVTIMAKALTMHDVAALEDGDCDAWDMGIVHLLLNVAIDACEEIAVTRAGPTGCLGGCGYGGENEGR